MRVIRAKVMFVIDGVVERDTSRMLSATLESRLDLACYVQVVTNYVTAFDLAMQQDFHAIVMPHKEEIDGFSKSCFMKMVTNVYDFSSALIHTVDHDNTFHVDGETVRSTISGGYMVGDLVSAITAAVKKKHDKVESRVRMPEHCDRVANSTKKCTITAGSKAIKRPRDATLDAQPQPHSKHSRHENNQRSHASSQQEAAYQQFCHWQWQWQWQWQMFYQAQTEAQDRRNDYHQSSPFFSAPHLSTAESHHFDPYQHCSAHFPPFSRAFSYPPVPPSCESILGHDQHCPPPYPRLCTQSNLPCGTPTHRTGHQDHCHSLRRAARSDSCTTHGTTTTTEGEEDVALFVQGDELALEEPLEPNGSHRTRESSSSNVTSGDNANNFDWFDQSVLDSAIADCFSAETWVD